MKSFLNKMYYTIFKKSANNTWQNNKHIFTNKTIYEYLKEQVGNNLEYYALNYFGKKITYGEMFRHIRYISKSLKYLGIKKGDIITICMPNTPEALEMFYAINNIGAVADMVHPLSAPNELKYYLTETKSQILMLYDANYERYKTVLEELNIHKIILASVSETMPLNISIGYKIFKGLKIKKAPLFNRTYIRWKEFITYSQLFRKPIDNENMTSINTALILHSGGTTGISKCIKLSNFNFNAEIIQSSTVVEKLKPKDKVLAILPIFHGFGLASIIACPLTLLCEVILIPEFDNKRFAKMIDNYKPNVIAGVPTLWEAMLQNKDFASSDLSNLKYMISGGDYLPSSLEEKMNLFLKNHNANIVISKGYGMTESVAATAYTFDGTNMPNAIGKPLIGNTFTICKPDTEEVLPIETEGELCVCGPTVMQGYLNNLEETKKVLKRHKDGKIWLHTGDAGYISKDGIIYFTQRLKRMIITSGFNVYPSAIEEVILKHPKVRECCVVGVPHPYKIQVPISYIVLESGYSPNIKLEAELRLLCKKNLPLYAIPKKYIFRSELPKTLYNKIDYKLLEKEIVNY